jgi:NAD(P)-dependent dehydrogenase (short-subunit alcohol dehydrogenase family)
MKKLATVAGGILGWRMFQRLREANLAGQVALVTGGSRGLGFLIARDLAREGCKIVICARDEAELRRAARDLEGRGADVLAVVCDVSARDEVDRLIARAGERFGGVDLLVNNAGIIQVGPVSSMTYEDFERAMAINFWGTVNTTMAVLPQMRAKGGGRIANVTSIGGTVAVPHLLPYDCAKFAMYGFSEGLRAELARDGIVVTTIVPGLMRTGSPVHAFFKGDQAREFAWFAAGDALPFTAMHADRAARRIVRAIKRGESDVTLSIQARLFRTFHALFPGLTADLMGLINRLLPRDAGRAETEGKGLYAEATPRVKDALERQGRRTNQLNGRS